MENDEPTYSSFDVDLADKIRVLPGASPTACSFQIEKEDHTLGNALRFFIMKNPDVEFCGYTIPHPSETKMHLRIQTWEDTGTTAFEALRKGCDDLIDFCEATSFTFTEALEEFEAEQGEQ